MAIPTGRSVSPANRVLTTLYDAATLCLTGAHGEEMGATFGRSAACHKVQDIHNDLSRPLAFLRDSLF